MGWSGEGVWKNKDGSSRDPGEAFYDTDGEHWTDASSMWGKVSGQGDRDRAREAKNKAKDSREQQYLGNLGIAEDLDKADQSYLDNTLDNMKDYRTGRDDQYWQITSEIKDLREQAQNQANDANAVYTNTIRPNNQKLLDQQMQYAGDAMSLQEAGDPNNQIHQAVRGMYDERADMARKQGMADFGVMSSLGAQAAAGQMGNVPMTAGAMQNIYAANQSQAGESVAAAQRKVDALQQQGIDRGFDESDRQYQRGERERDRASSRLGEFQNSEMAYQDQMGRFRNENYGYSNDLYGLGMGRVSDDYRLDQGYSDLNRDTKYGQGARQTAISDQYHGGIQQSAANQQAAAGANQAGMLSTLGTVGGAAIGGYFGGGGGAAAGAQVGGAVGGQMGGGNRGGYMGGYQPQPTYGNGQMGGGRLYQQGQGGGGNNYRGYA